ncbi:rod shape-determining protein MreC [bacterium]|nr:rod shape-determining protein MreC [bacterium]
MKRRIDFSSGSIWRDTAVLFITAGIALFLMSQNNSSWLMPFKRVTPEIFSHLEAPARDILKAGKLRDENYRLARALADSALVGQWACEALLENQRLRVLLDLKERALPELIAAEIIGRAVPGRPGRVHLMTNSRLKISSNCAIITDVGLAGRVTGRAGNYIIGQLLTDPAIRIGARIQRSRVQGIVRWAYGNVCIMEGVSSGSDIIVGDRIVTSGQSEIYPGGILIGYVLNVESKRKGLFKTVSLRTAIDFNCLETVMILLDSKDSKGPIE